MSGDILLVIVIGTALAFEFTNGFHDTANVVATSISTRRSDLVTEVLKVSGLMLRT